MNIQTQKLNLMKLILDTENQQVLDSITNIFANASKTDFWATLTNEQKFEIEMGLKDISNGDVVEYDSIVGPFRKSDKLFFLKERQRS